MIENNLGHDLSDQYDTTKNTNSSLGSTEEGQQLDSSVDKGDLNDEEDNPMTQSNEQDNDKSKNPADTTSADKNRNIATSFHDNTRTSGRANEADDRLDTGSGGLSAGGVKSATDL
jgi:hypothetical protein